MTPDEPAPRASTDPAASASQDPPSPARGRRDLLLLVALAAVLAVLVRALVLQSFYIPSASMEPGLVENDRIVVQKVSYWFWGSPERGDVVVFEDPGGWLGPDEQPGPQNPVTKTLAAVGLYPSAGHLVKRVVGVPGDFVECCDAQGRILVNGEPLDERDYVREQDLQCAGPMTGDCQWLAGPVPDGQLFVLGDNRGASGDSSVHLCTEIETDCTDDPYVDEDLVVGKVAGVVWPFPRFGGIDNNPDSFDEVPDA